MKGILLILSLFVMGHIYSEESKVRQFLLKCYAFKEVELLQLIFWLFRVSGLSVIKQAWFKKTVLLPLCPFSWDKGCCLHGGHFGGNL